VTLENTRTVLSKLGYSAEGVGWMVREISALLAKYSSPVEAARLFEATFPTCRLARFGESNFRRFLKDIDPGNHAFINLIPFSPEEMGAMEWSEIEAHKKLCASPPHDFDSLAQLCTYEALCSCHFRMSRGDEVDAKHLPTARFISVPVGGKRRKS